MYVSQRNTQREQRDRHVEQCATNTFLCFTFQSVLPATFKGCTSLHLWYPLLSVSLFWLTPHSSQSTFVPLTPINPLYICEDLGQESNKLSLLTWFHVRGKTIIIIPAASDTSWPPDSARVKTVVWKLQELKLMWNQNPKSGSSLRW